MKEEVFTVSAQLLEANPQHICNLRTAQLANHLLTAEALIISKLALQEKQKPEDCHITLLREEKQASISPQRLEGNYWKSRLKTLRMGRITDSCIFEQVSCQAEAEELWLAHNSPPNSSHPLFCSWFCSWWWSTGEEYQLQQGLEEQ